MNWPPTFTSRRHWRAKCAMLVRRLAWHWDIPVRQIKAMSTEQLRALRWSRQPTASTAIVEDLITARAAEPVKERV